MAINWREALPTVKVGVQPPTWDEDEDFPSVYGNLPQRQIFYQNLWGPSEWGAQLAAMSVRTDALLGFLAMPHHVSI